MEQQNPRQTTAHFVPGKSFPAVGYAVIVFMSFMAVIYVTCGLVLLYLYMLKRATTEGMVAQVEQLRSQVKQMKRNYKHKDKANKTAVKGDDERSSKRKEQKSENKHETQPKASSSREKKPKATSVKMTTSKEPKEVQIVVLKEVQRGEVQSPFEQDNTTSGTSKTHSSRITTSLS